MQLKILAINPGSTSTKISVFKNNKELFHKDLNHPAKKLQQFKKVLDQYDFRKKLILQSLKKAQFDIYEFNAVVGRGGALRPVKSGVYRVNDLMIEDLIKRPVGEHASNLGAILAREIAGMTKNPKNAFIVDPVVVDEMEDMARISGIPEIVRISAFHALNQRAMAKKYAKRVKRKYEDLNLIVAHLGGGISISAHKKGRVIDTIPAALGEGPFTPERSGGVPLQQFAELCFSGKYTHAEIKKMIMGKGGLLAYLGTSDVRKIEKKINKGNKKVKFILESMAYQIAKEIGAMATVLKGKVEAIILTGGIAFNKRVCKWIKERVGFIAKVIVYPGEMEVEALAQGVVEALNGLAAISF
jgi:butyrate kinase